MRATDAAKTGLATGLAIRGGDVVLVLEDAEFAELGAVLDVTAFTAGAGLAAAALTSAIGALDGAIGG